MARKKGKKIMSINLSNYCSNIKKFFTIITMKSDYISQALSNILYAATPVAQRLHGLHGRS